MRIENFKYGFIIAGHNNQMMNNSNSVILPWIEWCRHFGVYFECLKLAINWETSKCNALKHDLKKKKWSQSAKSMALTNRGLDI